MINGTTWLEFKCSRCDRYHYRNVGPMDESGVAMRLAHDLMGLLVQCTGASDLRAVQLFERDGQFYTLGVVAGETNAGPYAAAFGAALTPEEAKRAKREILAEEQLPETFALFRERGERLTGIIQREAGQTTADLLETVATVGLAAITRLRAPEGAAEIRREDALPAGETPRERILSTAELNKLWGD